MNRAQRRSNVDILSTLLNKIRENDFTYGYYIQNGYHVIIIATSYDRYAVKYVIHNNDLIIHDIVKIDVDLINLQNFIHMHADNIASMTDFHFHSGSNTYNLENL